MSVTIPSFAFRTGPSVYIALAVFLLVVQAALFAQTATPIYSFSAPPDVVGVRSQLVFDAAGNAYGTSETGGAYNYGGVFQLTPPAFPGGPWVETIIHSFDGGPNGTAGPNQLAIDTLGNLYGTTQAGKGAGCQSSACGRVFTLVRPSSPSGAWGFHVLHRFAGGIGDGSNPVFGVVLIGNKKYGTTMNGGPNGGGIVYELAPSNEGYTEKIIYSFPGYSGDGSLPVGLTRDAEGNLYGVTLGGGAGGGVVFKLTPPASGSGSWTESVLFSPDNATYGNELADAPVLDKAGALWGTTQYGGPGNAGTLFRLSPPSVSGGQWQPTLIHAFDLNTEGLQNGALLYERSANTVYGMTPGLNVNCGSIFQVTETSSGVWTYSTAYTFSSPAVGCNPNLPLNLDGSGNLFGVALDGGANGYGSAFQFTP